MRLACWLRDLGFGWSSYKIGIEEGRIYEGRMKRKMWSMGYEAYMRNEAYMGYGGDGRYNGM